MFLMRLPKLSGAVAASILQRAVVFDASTPAGDVL